MTQLHTPARKILFAVQNFRQGCGGAPESVRLMAAQLMRLGFVSDVYDRGSIIRDVGRLSLLPHEGVALEPFDLATTSEYVAILQTGPWQSLQRLGRLLNARHTVPWIYLPRGGLGRAEFSRLRDLKKYPYLAFVERAFIAASDFVVFSSETERRHTLPWSFNPSKAVVIPDFVAPTLDGAASEARKPITTFAFLAEISPRKGLHLLVDAFIAWVRSRGLGGRVRLVVGGAPRLGSETYLETIRARYAPVAQEVEIVFLGAIPHGDRAAFYSATDVMVVASSFESFGLTAFEALSQGCLVVSTPDVGALEQIGSGSGVIISLTAKVECMVQALETSLEELDRNPRADRVADAKKVVLALNDFALARWSNILALDDVGAAPVTSPIVRRPE